MNLDVLRQLAADWLAADPDPETRQELRALLDADDVAGLRERFDGRLEFGTAGLRGALGAGPQRMNRVLVRRVAMGLATYLLGHVDDAADRGVVVGYDGRKNSRVFAEDTARVLAARGVRVQLAEDVTPTPFLAYAVRDQGAVAGVMVTASHNPPGDNGYKVYWGHGGQIVPPHDTGISAAIDRVEETPRPPELDALHGVFAIPEGVEARYRRDVAALRVHPTTPETHRVRAVYTAMHGVGRRLLEAVLADAGHVDLHVVPAQADPDAAFPTVAFPNPEEKGALDLAMALARDVQADVIIAHDPDADRLAVAVPDATRPAGWRQLTGNEVGCLLADDLLAHGAGGGGPRMVANTIVSTVMLRRIAAAHGAEVGETLTGFKWLADAALRFEAAGGRFVLGFEEALGYSAGNLVRDKDGVSTALLLLDLVAHLKATGQTLDDRLAALARAHGLHASGQKAITLKGAEGQARISSVLAVLRASPPTSIAGASVVAWTDVAAGSRRTADGVSRLDLPPSDVLAYDLDDGARVLVRPSGTEPKLKIYLEVRVEVGAGGIDAARGAAAARLEALGAEMLAITGLG